MRGARCLDASGTALVDGPRQATAAHSLWDRVLGRPQHLQLELPLEGVPSEARAKFLSGVKDFSRGFGPKVGHLLLMRIGTPMVAATTPLAVELVAPHYRDGIVPNLIAGSALGGVWGAAVGAVLPFDGQGNRISRVKSAGMAAAGGVLLAPAVAIASKYVVDWITAPIASDRDAAEADAEAAKTDAENAEPAATAAESSKTAATAAETSRTAEIANPGN